MPHKSHRGRPRRRGCIDPQSVRLAVLTGLEDDSRAELRPDDRLHALAVEAFERQDDWTLSEHSAFWTAALNAWPHTRGAHPGRETAALVAANLAREGLAVDEIATVLALAPGTVRRYLPLGEHVYERGAEHTPDQGRALRRLIGTLEDDAPPLPRVFAPELGEAPAWTYLNPLIGVRFAMLARSPALADQLERGQAAFEHRWAGAPPRSEGLPG